MAPDREPLLRAIPITLTLKPEDLPDLFAQNRVDSDGELIADTIDRQIRVSIMHRDKSGMGQSPIKQKEHEGGVRHYTELPPNTEYAVVMYTDPQSDDWQSKPETDDVGQTKSAGSQKIRPIVGLTRSGSGARALEFTEASWTKFKPLCDLRGQQVGAAARAKSPLAISLPGRTPHAETNEPHVFLVVFEAEERAEVPSLELRTVHAIGDVTFDIRSLGNMLGGMGLHDLRTPREPMVTDVIAKKPIAAFEVHFVAPEKTDA